MSMSNETQVAKINNNNVPMGLNTSSSFELLQRVAKVFSTSTLVPKDYQGNLSNCIIAVNMAHRLKADPLLVIQNLYIVHGKPAWSAKFLISTFNQCGRFTSIRYRFEGKEGTDKWGCRAWAKEKSTGDEITSPLITIGLAKSEGWYQKPGSKWKTIPELMLMYRSSAWLVNTCAPEISMGLNTVDEIEDITDVKEIKNITPQQEEDIKEPQKSSLDILTEQLQEKREQEFFPEETQKIEKKGTITDKQRKMLYAVTNKIDKDTVSTYLIDTFGVEKFSQLNTEDVNIVLSWVESFNL